MRSRVTPELLLKALRAGISPKHLAAWVLQRLPRISRERALRQVLLQLQQNVDTLEGNFRVVAYTPIPLKSATLEELKRTLHQQRHKRVIIAQALRPKLVGGVILEHRGERVDTTVVNRIKQLEGALWQN